MTSSCSLETQTQGSCAQSLDKCGSTWLFYIKASAALLKIKENTTASKLTGHWLHVILPGYSQQSLELLLGRIPLLGLSGTPVLCCLLTSLFVSVSHPFSSHKSFVFMLRASPNSLCDSICLFPILQEIWVLCENPASLDFPWVVKAWLSEPIIDNLHMPPRPKSFGLFNHNFTKLSFNIEHLISLRA